jgi:hypothetical protein
MARNTRLVSAFGLLALSSAGLAGSPDAVIGDVAAGSLFGEAGGVAAYAFGYATCNLGDAPLMFVANSNDHPLWTQNLYRLKDGLFKQIALGHVVHGFFSLESSLCGSCSPVGMGNMGPGCSDVNSSGLAGSQNQLGPRWQVNPFTGEFPFPFFQSTPIPPTIGRRVQAAVADVDPAQNNGAVYWAEVQIVAPGEANEFDRRNNASSRRVQFSPALSPSFVEPTQREVSALVAWAAMDDQVHVGQALSFDDGAFYVASRAYDNGDGTWLYVYAVHNQNNHRGARAFELDLGSGSLTEPGFSSPAYHSGDGIDGVNFSDAPWDFSFMDDKARWETSTFDENPNANALRWGTAYTFWFTSTREPISSSADITFFKPGAGGDTSDIGVIKPRMCLGDLDNGGTVNFGDLNRVLSEFGQTGEGISGDANGDGVVNFPDLNIVVTEFGRENCY